jgi:hypothetical protein
MQGGPVISPCALEVAEVFVGVKTGIKEFKK